MIVLSNDHNFEYMTASGAMGFDGYGWPWEQPLRWFGGIDLSLFTIVLKTITLNPRHGNLRWYDPLRCVRLLRGGVLNSVGLTNPGLSEWCYRYGSKLKKERSLIASVHGNSLREWDIMISTMNQYPLVGVELNVSCPNVSQTIDVSKSIIEICRVCFNGSLHPILLKLGVTHDISYILPRVSNYIEAVSINAVPWNLVYPNQKSPLASLGGGALSGKIAQKYTWKTIDVSLKASDIPVIGCSVWAYSDMKKLWNFGVGAISFGAVFIPYPCRPSFFVRRMMKKSFT